MVLRPGVAATAALMLAFVGFDATGVSASRTAAPSACALVPYALLEKTFGEKFQDPPVETSAPPAYDGPAGTSCQYSSKPPFALGYQTQVDFQIYQESSAKVARDTFDKMAVYLADKSRGAPALGDAAYWGNKNDDESWLYVVKGNTHFSLGVQPKNETQVLGLATAVAKEF